MQWFGPPKLLLCFTFLALCLPAMGRLAVMSIDLGGEFMKIAIVKPGVPMEIVLNKESSRKTRAIVAFRDGERHFANDAYNTAVRFPAKAFWFLTHIIGHSYDDPIVEQFRQRFPYYKDIMLKDEERGTVSFKDSEGTVYSTEELLGMMLEKAREYAQDFAEQTIKDAVITVPPYYNQAERRAIMTAAELVGINVLQLMNHNAAVALNYGVFRRKNFNTTAQYYMFYDMGASSTVATVVSYQEVKTKDGSRTEQNPQLTVKGVGYDRTLGGFEMTLRLRDHLAKVFNSQKKRSEKVEDNPRAMAKLLKEAERVKKVLSANSDHKAQVEGLLEGEDFAAKVTREEYLEMISDLLDRATKPVEDALKTSEITMGEISEIILMGGGSRVPKVQELLLQFSGKPDLGKSVNTDEAAALGAVYQAAFLGKGFKVKTFHVRDANLFPINVEFEKQKSSEEAAAGEVTPAKTVKRNLFSRMNPYPQRKVMTFNKHFKDFTFDVRYANLDFLPEAERQAFDSHLLTNVSLSGLEDALGKHAESAEYKGVKAHFRMDESGVLHLEKAEAVFEKQEIPAEEPEESKEDQSTWSKIGNAFGGFFGGKEGEKPADSKEEGKTESSEEKADEDKKNSEEEGEAKKDDEKDKEEEEKKTPPKDDDEQKEKDEKKKDGEDEKKEGEKEGEKKEGEEKGEKKEEDGKKEAKKPPAPRTVVLKENIKANVEVKDMPDLSSERVKEARKRLEELLKKDQEKVAREKAKNELEGFIFDSQDRLSSYELYQTCSTEEERTSILGKLSEASDWLYEQPDDAKKEVFSGKLTELKAELKDVVHRVYEKEERPKALEALRQHLNATEQFLAKVHNMTDPLDPIFTPVELTTLNKLINETTTWRDNAVKEQDKLADHENPTLLVEAIGARIYSLEREMKYLINKAKNYRPKPKASEKADNSTQKGNNTDSETKKGDKAKKSEQEKDDDSEDATVEDEDDDTTTTSTPESQESAPDTEKKEGEEEEKEDKKKEEEEEEEKTEKDKSDSKKSDGDDDDKSGKKKRKPKRKSEQEEKSEDQPEETLELGSDDLPTEGSEKDATHTEL